MKPKLIELVTIPLLAFTINKASAKNIISGNISSVPSNNPSKAQVVFTNTSTNEQKIAETDSLTGDYSINLPTGNYNRQVLQLNHYLFHEENIQINGNRIDSLEMIEAWTPTSTVYNYLGPGGGLMLLKGYTFTIPGSANLDIEPWKWTDRPIKVFFNNDSMPSQNYRTIMEEALQEITNKSNGTITYIETQTRPDINIPTDNGIIIRYLNNNQMTVPGSVGYTNYLRGYPDGTLRIVEIQLNKQAPANPAKSVNLRELLRVLGFGANSADPTMVMYYQGSAGSGGIIHPDEAEILKRYGSLKHKPLMNMDRYDTTTVKPLRPNAIRIDEPQTIDSYVLEQNYPNPYNGNTKIRYSIPQPTQIKLEV